MGLGEGVKLDVCEFGLGEEFDFGDIFSIIKILWKIQHKYIIPYKYERSEM